MASLVRFVFDAAAPNPEAPIIYSQGLGTSAVSLDAARAGIASRIKQLAFYRHGHAIYRAADGAVVDATLVPVDVATSVPLDVEMVHLDHADAREMREARAVLPAGVRHVRGHVEVES